MINFRFVRTQLKNVVIPLIIFFVILIILIIPALTQNSFAPAVTINKTSTGGSSSSHLGGSVLLSYIYFGIPGFVVLTAFSIILLHLLIIKEIDRGYFASWLTLPMSRKTILNSKFFVLMTTLLMLYFSAFIFQLIIFPIVFKDFSLQIFLNLLLYNFAFILLAVLWASINWIVICFFNKPAKSLAIASAISILFIVFAVLDMVSNSEGFEYLKYFKYVTITSFINSPFRFGELPALNDPSIPPDFNGTITAEILKFKTLDFAWQLPVMMILSVGLFPLGKMFIVRKDLNL